MKTNEEMELKVFSNPESKKKCWTLAYAEASSFYIPNALHIQGNDDLLLVDDDGEACKEAEKDGVPLIYGLENVPDGAYVDTEENRAIIEEMLNTYPEYKELGELNKSSSKETIS